MPQSLSTALPKHQKKERWGTNKHKTNATYQTTDARTKKNFNSGTVFERLVWKLRRRVWVCGCVRGGSKTILTQLQITNIYSVRIFGDYLICEPSQQNTYNTYNQKHRDEKSKGLYGNLQPGHKEREPQTCPRWARSHILTVRRQPSEAGWGWSLHLVWGQCILYVLF